jgi:TetR/AcrR family transcriptional regulator, regulator of cefoperazone and chloramphenicol sensitivity
MPKENRIQTRENLLKAAYDIFARKGFRDATIAEISRRAGTNIAAVNYHFGSKEILYVESWRCAFRESLHNHPTDGDVSENATAEERFRGIIRAIIERVADTRNRDYWFMLREYASPTGLLEEAKGEELLPFHMKMEALLRELLGPMVTDQDVMSCEISIINQCLNPTIAGSKFQGENVSEEWLSNIIDINAYIDFILIFCLAGIKAIRENAEQKK